MWRIHNRGKLPPIGLDISPDGIRMLQLVNSEKPLKVLSGAFWRPNLRDFKSDLDSDHAVHAVREIFHAGRFRGHRVATGISSEDVHIRNVRIENVRPERLYANIHDKARGAFGFDINHAKLFVLGSTPILQEDGGMQEIVLLAIENHVISQRRELLEKMGLELERIDAEPISVFKTVQRFLRRASDRNITHTIVNVATNSTLVIVSRGAEICFLKRIDIGTRKLTQAVQNYLGLSFQDAAHLRSYLMEENIKHSHSMGLVNPEQGSESPTSSLLWSVHDSVRSRIDALVLDIGLCLRYCSTTFGCPQIEKVILTGSGAWDPSLIYMLGESLGLRCEVARPMQSIDVSQCPIFDDRRNMLSDWTNCVGLSLGWTGNQKQELSNTNTNTPDSIVSDGGAA